MTDMLRNPPRCRRNVIFVALLAISCGDRGSQGVASTQRLVDLFNHDSTEVADSPQIQTEPRAAWRFDTLFPAASPFNGWTSESGVDGLQVVEGRLSGDVIDDVPILHVEWVDGGGPDDRLRSVEIDLLATAGANLAVELRDEDDELDDLTSEDWTLTTPILPGDESRTYSITSDGDINSSDIRHVLIRPTDEAGARFEIASVRLLFDRSTWRRHPQVSVGRA